MHIIVHDFAGHPFQAELSRELARRGHRVDHAYFAGDIGPKGDLVHGPSDPPTLTFSALAQNISYSKSNFLKRRAGDVSYGKALAQHLINQKPDVIICGNAPTEVVSPLPEAARKAGSAFIYWVQDFNGLAAKRLLAKKFGFAGSLIGDYYMWLDKRHLRSSDHIVNITEAFTQLTSAWGVPTERVTVIPNWGAIDQIHVGARDTQWAADNELSEGPRFIYSGTLALKHNPALIEALAREIEDRGQVIVSSAGVGADYLAERSSNFPALKLLPLQPFKVFEQVLSSADVLLSVIEREAGTFSVPSKILSYLCAGRPIVLAAPRDNLAARIIEFTGAGTVVEPEDEPGFVAAALSYVDDQEAALRAGAAGRAYAEANFVIADVADRFEAVFAKAIAHAGLASTQD